MISQHPSLSIFLTISYLDPLLLLVTEFLLKYHLWLHDFATPISLNFPHNFLLDPCCWCLSFFSPPSPTAWFFPKHPSLTNFLTYFTSNFIADFSTLSLIIFFTYFFCLVFHSLLSCCFSTPISDKQDEQNILHPSDFDWFIDWSSALYNELNGFWFFRFWFLREMDIMLICAEIDLKI